MNTRGTYKFETGASDILINNPANLALLRKLFRDGKIIDEKWGPGDPGDFDYGSWHILCHLAGGAGVLKTKEGPAWCGITHVPATDTYLATITCRHGGIVVTMPLDSGEGAAAAHQAETLGFIEGSSLGHISARGVNDPPEAFNKWPRQKFDQDINSPEDGGTVWEHWSTTRDIRPANAYGMAVLRAYLILVSKLGGRFVAAVARGRREHEHPTQLAALVKAGVLTVAEATWDVSPNPIPKAVQDLLYEARPADALAAATALPWTPGAQRYFMFERRIGKWSKTADVRKDLGL
ncbi:MAG TPA: hypothetical protein VMC06_14805 [Opitutaceae bacterium]|nr:hypothetical protein [Opitutaceae bacterium]